MRRLLAPVAVSILLHLFAAPSSALKHIATANFLVVCRDQDYANGTIKDADLQRWGEWLEAAHARFVGALKFRAPNGHLPVKRKVRAVIHPFGESQKYQAYVANPGFASRADGLLHLNMPLYLDRTRELANKCTAAHELFHLIQYSYDTDEEPWLYESTARWAAAAAFPDLDQEQYCIEQERKFLLRSALPLSFDFPYALADFAKFRSMVGHPYGASVFFRHVTMQAKDEGLVRRIWEEAADVLGPNGMLAVSRALGGAGFRRAYDRFAVGAVLGPMAPPENQLADAAKTFAAPDVRVPRIPIDGWLEHCRTQADRPDFAPYRPPMMNPIDLVELASTGRKPVESGNGIKAWLGGRGGIRCLRVPRPADADGDTTLKVRLEAADDEATLIALARYGGKEIRIVPAAPGRGGQEVALPELGKTGDNAFLVLVRYVDTPSAGNLPLELELERKPKKLAVGDIRLEWRAQPPTEYPAVVARSPVFKALSAGAEGRELRIRLYHAQDAGGPFVAAEEGRTETRLNPHLRAWSNDYIAINRPDGNTSVPLVSGTEDSVVVIDALKRFERKQPPVHRPFQYQLGLQWVVDGSDEGAEMRSPTLSPAPPVVRIDGLPDDAAERDESIGQVALALPGQSFHAWGAELVVTSGSGTWHYWTPRVEGGKVFGGDAYFGKAWVHPQAPIADQVTLVMNGEGLTARRVLTLRNRREKQDGIASGQAYEKEWAEKEPQLQAELARLQQIQRDIETRQAEAAGKKDTSRNDFGTWANAWKDAIHARRSVTLHQDFTIPWERAAARIKAARARQDHAQVLTLLAEQEALANREHEIEMAHYAELTDYVARCRGHPMNSGSDWYDSFEKLIASESQGPPKRRDRKLQDLAGERLGEATRAGDAAAYVKAKDEVLANLARAGQADSYPFYQSMADDLARVTGDRTGAADLYRRGQKNGHPAFPSQYGPAWWPEKMPFDQ